MPLTLFRYISGQFAAWFLAVFLGLAALLLMFDVVELVRRAASRPEVSVWIMLKMAMLRLPHLSETTISFAMLFGSMLAFWRLARYQELVVARAAGVSVWQILAPALLVAVVVGVVKVAAFGPFASVSYSNAEQMNVEYFGRQPYSMTVAGSGLWLRDVSTADHSVIHAKRIGRDDRTLEEVQILQYRGEDEFLQRLDAERARLEPGQWVLEDVRITEVRAVPRTVETLVIPTRLDWERIENSFASPRGMLLWRIPAFISTLEEAGFPATRHRTYFHSALAAPLILCAMVLIAAAFSLRPNRRSGMLALVVGGVVAGLAYYIISEVFLRLGYSGRIPAELAAWAPAGIGWMLGTATLLHLEDG